MEEREKGKITYHSKRSINRKGRQGEMQKALSKREN